MTTLLRRNSVLVSPGGSSPSRPVVTDRLPNCFRRRRSFLPIFPDLRVSSFGRSSFKWFQGILTLMLYFSPLLLSPAAWRWVYQSINSCTRLFQPASPFYFVFRLSNKQTITPQRSSTREPAQVFRLLEGIYQHFDK
jgi:hypothetical protein